MKMRLMAPLFALVMCLTLSACHSATDLKLDYELGQSLLDYQKDRADYETKAEQALSDLAGPNATSVPGGPEDTGAEQQAQSEVPFAVNWDSLRSANSDVVGWIYCADTRINYPVVQTTDNEYYLHRDFYSKQTNAAGTLFADHDSALGVTYSNYIIYGHNMKDGSMFAAVESYDTQDFYEQHPMMYFLTPDQNYRIDLIAGRTVESAPNTCPGGFDSDADYSSYLNDITSCSLFATHTSISTSHQLITLSTYNESDSDSGLCFLLQGLLIPIE